MKGLRLSGKLLSLEGAMAAMGLRVGDQTEIGEQRAVESNSGAPQYLSRCVCKMVIAVQLEGNLIIASGAEKGQAAMRQRGRRSSSSRQLAWNDEASQRTRSKRRDCR